MNLSYKAAIVAKAVELAIQTPCHHKPVDACTIRRTDPGLRYGVVMFGVPRGTEGARRNCARPIVLVENAEAGQTTRRE
jgi:hypothetical protein